MTDSQKLLINQVEGINAVMAKKSAAMVQKESIMRTNSFDLGLLMSSKLFGVLALALLVVAVELSIGEANSWFFLGLNILEWTNPLEEVRLVSEVSMESVNFIFACLNGLFDALSGVVMGRFAG
ncbi:hypothetical protein [Shewanella sp.]|uniref:hypothetical protein n=1 Tax=Shewanella sp. TaxID=50422 RepID=UPI003A8A2768